MLTVEQIYEAMRPNFLWAPNPKKPLETLEDFTDSISIAPPIFIGLSLLYGVDEDDVMVFLDISHEEYRNKLKRFRTHIQEAMELMEQGINFNPDKPQAPFRYFAKFRLCKNNIELKYRAKAWISLKEMFTIY